MDRYSGRYVTGPTFTSAVGIITDQAVASNILDVQTISGRFATGSPAQIEIGYGENGFHLDFSTTSYTDASASGNDWMLNGNTPMVSTGRYNDDVAGTDYSEAYQSLNMFAGFNMPITVICQQAGYHLDPKSGQINVTSTFRGFFYLASGTFSTVHVTHAGGTPSVSLNNTNADYAWGLSSLGVTGEVTQVTWYTGSGTGGPYVYAWEVDGVVLVDTELGNHHRLTYLYGTDTGLGGQVRDTAP